MGILDDIFEEIKSIFDGRPNSPWVQRKATSNLDMVNCNGVARNDDSTKTCFMCVAANKCYFVNDDSKMPKYPQHPKCHCRLIGKNKPTVSMIILRFPMEKITEYLFTDPEKAGIMEAMGYIIEDAQEVYYEIAKQAKEQYVKGNYEFRKHNQNGYEIRMYMILKGKRNANRTFYEFYSGWKIYPNLMLKNNTPFAGWVKNTVY